ncbi:hypothetical protein [Lacticaseibacillus jixiensis]|uniref:hypothetical protein n=1 Tax=Lacticaseibacillus jixiensis TaxID=3231926 RepID=UPI0036F40459
MKKLRALLLSVAMLGLAAATTTALNVHADGTNPVTPATTGKVGPDVSNNATLHVEGGDLTFTKPDDVKFTDTTVKAVYTDGYSDDKTTGTTTVSDFLGDAGTWTLSVSAGGWANGTETTVMENAAKLTVKSTDEKSQTATFGAGKNDAQPIVSGGEGTKDYDLSYDLSIPADKAVSLKAGTYTNTLTWSINNVPGTDAGTTTTGATTK